MLNNLDKQPFWGDKRYHSLDFNLKSSFGKKLYKLSLNGGMTCPNRDGTLDYRGCIFCSQGGSGDFTSPQQLSITKQIEEAKKLVINKLPSNQPIQYIAYFQAYTNTHAPVSYLESIFQEAIKHPDIAILSIATRPDCLDDDILSLLDKLNKKKPVWIELGLQTIHDDTAKWIRRGYDLSIFHKAVERLHLISVKVIVHTILGLPRETKNDMLKTMEYIGHLSNQGLVHGIKLQLLHILKGTDLATIYLEDNSLHTLSMDEYIDLVISCLERLPKDLVIHRLTGDGPKKILLAPLWSSNKRLVLNSLHKKMKEIDTWQGKYYDKELL
ncbi:MAG: TIGR01212 family radical SAM protein [Clostridiales bacterium]|jgi:radical SAM protein (TIGR01212 family)|nr:TIGR01212 family radical SAM protein [Bacillota bacterium]NLK02922.1 TIGR01212 family radical SAM protein [Clostridiales bacterium]